MIFNNHWKATFIKFSHLFIFSKLFMCVSCTLGRWFGFHLFTGIYKSSINCALFCVCIMRSFQILKEGRITRKNIVEPWHKRGFDHSGEYHGLEFCQRENKALSVNWIRWIHKSSAAKFLFCFTKIYKLLWFNMFYH